MGKRSNFERIPRDYYPTPKEAVEPLFPHLKDVKHFVEPCAGNGALIDHLEKINVMQLDELRFICSYACDIEPQRKDIVKKNALSLMAEDVPVGDCFITNPPWDREVLHPLIFHLTSIKPAWLLFDADWMHTKQSSIFQKMLKKVVSIGRIKWIEGSKNTGKDNCCWYYFDENNEDQTKFYGRVE
tara:strand:+ start:460 stop:1014 length:555 start_codon:yes stop_codon:yes gene_type:complete